MNALLTELWLFATAKLHSFRIKYRADYIETVHFSWRLLKTANVKSNNIVQSILSTFVVVRPFFSEF
ncbi:unnamed protein product [Oikopleura dioica]|uniref:Uncharacterized protein n=1 Tax=Oikopleura dioica TaxID=34765 RepID=E4WYX3_OIKDI|nr:unnamed protein product [Oikopleura dioica]